MCLKAIGMCAPAYSPSPDIAVFLPAVRQGEKYPRPQFFPNRRIDNLNLRDRIFFS